MIERLAKTIRAWFRPEPAPRVQQDRREIEELEARTRQIRARAEALGVTVDVTTRRYRHAGKCKQH